MNHQEIIRIILEKNSSGSSHKNIQSDKTSFDCQVHLLPCQIHWNGPADVSKYFHVRSMPDNSTYYATFRGRGLEGRPFILPSSYEGAVYDSDGHISYEFESSLNDNLTDSIVDSNETIGPIKKWYQIGNFSSFNIWNQIPDHNVECRNPIRALKEWIDLANILHSNTKFEEEETDSIS